MYGGVSAVVGSHHLAQRPVDVMLGGMNATSGLVPHVTHRWQETFFQLESALCGQKICLLTGAGCSTESGIPDYRGEGTLRRARNPIQFREFSGSAQGRQRYWARAALGWPRFRAAAPNRAHHAAAVLEERGWVQGVITQNVDRLHAKAGSQRVVELHGALEEVVCLQCRVLEPRERVQDRLLVANPGWLEREVQVAPDGDAELDGSVIAQFNVVSCLQCGGELKPNVVFFGEGVPKQRVDDAFALLEQSDCLLVVGSSLAVFSGYRFVRRALERAQPVYVVNIGATRADPVARLRVAGPVGEVMELLAARALEETRDDRDRVLRKELSAD